MSLHEEMTPWLNHIGRELIAATPEHWLSAQLLLKIEATSKTTQSMAHEISCPDGMRDVVAPTDELMDATCALVQMCEAHQKPFLEMDFTARSDPGGNWRFHVEWKY